jgi:hypothetical protein
VCSGDRALDACPLCLRGRKVCVRAATVGHRSRRRLQRGRSEELRSRWCRGLAAASRGSRHRPRVRTNRPSLKPAVRIRPLRASTLLDRVRQGCPHKTPSRIPPPRPHHYDSGYVIRDDLAQSVPLRWLGLGPLCQGSFRNAGRGERTLLSGSRSSCAGASTGQRVSSEDRRPLCGRGCRACRASEGRKRPPSRHGST